MTSVEHAIERANNLAEACKDDPPKSELDLEAGGRFEFGDRYIDIIPDKTREGVSIYFYRNGKNTAAVGLSLRAALVLATRLPEILNKEYREQIIALTEKLKQEEQK